MEKRLLSIGEALIDFIPEEKGKALKEVSGFQPEVGGAPANVCGAFTRLGGKATMITQVGADPFGDKIVDRFKEAGIDCSYVARTSVANTSLAFVALKEDGNREFSFYRKPGADMLLSENAIQREWFEDAFCLHFCSVSLGNFPMKDAHKAAISYALEAGALISFDPNLRLALWDSEEDLREAVLEFIPFAHILKISDEEVAFITGKENIEDALPQLFTGNVEVIVYTKGADGAMAYTKRCTASTPGIKVQAADTTGAGDGFIGSFLHQLYTQKVTNENIQAITKEALEESLTYANRFSAISVQKKGAIASYPTAKDMIE